MTGGKGQNQHGFERKRDKQAERRRPHADKYASRASASDGSHSKERADEHRD